MPCTTDASLNFARVVEVLGKTIKCLGLNAEPIAELLTRRLEFIGMSGTTVNPSHGLDGVAGPTRLTNSR